MTIQGAIAETVRGGFIENRHWGWLTVCDVHGHTLYSTPDSGSCYSFYRSSAKPFQAMPIVLSGLHQGLSRQELAIVCASHAASPQHLTQVFSLLEKGGFTPEDLHCGAHPPIDRQMQQQMQAAGGKPESFHNNCSGQHAGMLYYCRKKGYDPATYSNPEHPLQQEIGEIFREYAGLEKAPPIAVDGCVMPTAYLPISAMAQLYARLGVEKAFEPVVAAMTQEPVLVGNTGHIDTALMQVTGGRLLAKVGAEGLLCISRIGQGEGLALKISDGSNLIRARVTLEALRTLGWLTEEELNHPDLKPLDNLTLSNTRNMPVGRIDIHLPAYQPSAPAGR